MYPTDRDDWVSLPGSAQLVTPAACRVLRSATEVHRISLLTMRVVPRMIGIVETLSKTTPKNQPPDVTLEHAATMMAGPVVTVVEALLQLGYSITPPTSDSVG